MTGIEGVIGLTLSAFPITTNGLAGIISGARSIGYLDASLGNLMRLLRSQNRIFLNNLEDLFEDIIPSAERAALANEPQRLLASSAEYQEGLRIRLGDDYEEFINDMMLYVLFCIRLPLALCHALSNP